MEVMMNEEERKPSRELPPIPDYPDAPLPAWKHYGIINYADQRIKDELANMRYEGYMVGLEVAYMLEDEKSYAMSFGKISKPDEATQKEETEVEIPLSDEFLVDLYQMLTELIPANCPNYSGQMSTELTIVVTGSEYVIKVTCTVPQQCALNHKDKRWCKKINNGPWTCLAGHPRCG
jgi:hypothetical protein